jgi:hypothetical protein
VAGLFLEPNPALEVTEERLALPSRADHSRVIPGAGGIGREAEVDDRKNGTDQPQSIFAESMSFF